MASPHDYRRASQRQMGGSAMADALGSEDTSTQRRRSGGASIDYQKMNRRFIGQQQDANKHHQELLDQIHQEDARLPKLSRFRDVPSKFSRTTGGKDEPADALGARLKPSLDRSGSGVSTSLPDKGGKQMCTGGRLRAGTDAVPERSHRAGQVPKYLLGIKAELAQKELDKVLAKNKKKIPKGFKVLDEKERVQRLEGIHQQLQLSQVLDTPNEISFCPLKSCTHRANVAAGAHTVHSGQPGTLQV
eukprot:GHVT01099864.1.p2 GENE.GHVT01099864.1~~GHVT01099864.1.p2  ORF type:complete len:246 (+),score=35.72 GHVT01099864.1:213-950(+)